MNCVAHAINMVTGSDIDEYLLKLAFENPNANFNGNWFGLFNNTTVEQGIREKVIYRTVLPSCKVSGGKTEYIDLTGARIRDLGNGYIEVNVPDSLTGGRKIVVVEEVYMGSMASAAGMLGMGANADAQCGSGSLNEMMGSFIDNLSGNRSMPQTYSNIHMTGNNSFVIAGMNGGTFSMTARCVLEYDQGMSSIHPRAYDTFGDLCILATKAYIYRTCRRPIQESVIRSGVPLDSIKDDVEEYRSAWQDYREFFATTWTKTMAYSDTQRMANTINMTVPSRF